MSVRNPEAAPGDDDEIVMAANTSTQAGKPEEQIEYALMHMRHVKQGAAIAITEVENSAQEALKRTKKGKVN